MTKRRKIKVVEHPNGADLISAVKRSAKQKGTSSVQAVGGLAGCAFAVHVQGGKRARTELHHRPFPPEGGEKPEVLALLKSDDACNELAKALTRRAILRDLEPPKRRKR